METAKGTKNETVELNTNYKTIIMNFFKELIFLRELNDKELEIVNLYKDKVPSFNALVEIFHNDGASESLRRKTCEFFCSTDSMRKILKSRANSANKIKMIKFMEVLRLNLERKG